MSILKVKVTTKHPLYISGKRFGRTEFDISITRDGLEMKFYPPIFVVMNGSVVLSTVNIEPITKDTHR